MAFVAVGFLFDVVIVVFALSVYALIGFGKV